MIRVLQNSPRSEESPMRTYRIAAIPGDGIGIEVIAAGLKVLEILAARDKRFRLEIEHFPWSSAYYLEHGYYIPEGGLEKLKGFDAIFFGAVGAPNEVPSAAACCTASTIARCACPRIDAPHDCT